MCGVVFRSARSRGHNLRLALGVRELGQGRQGEALADVATPDVTMRVVDARGERQRAQQGRPRLDIGDRCARQRWRCRCGQLRSNRHQQRMPHRTQHFALEGIPHHQAPVVARRRRSHIAGPDNAYSTMAANSSFGGSITSAISTAMAPTIAANGTRSAFGPSPLPLKLL